jgi:predicted phosphoadenosine phosphosulfate sulfurtransferase
MGKRFLQENVLDAARQRVAETFDTVERVYIAFSGGKDSSVMFHLVMEEARKRNVRVGVMFIDMEAQYADTIKHAKEMFQLYRDNIDPHWICIPMRLRNAVTNYEPQWIAWDPTREQDWIRPKPHGCKGVADYPFLFDAMDDGIEFEEFIVMFGRWYGQGKKTAGFIGIRAQESLHRYCAIATWEKRDLMLNGRRWTTKIVEQVYNVYPIYDWLTEDIWRFHAAFPDRPHNTIYDKMQMAGVPLSDQRLCQPFGDEQRRGLWLYHILEPETWFRLVARVNGVNSGALYLNETGNINGYDKVTLPPGHTWQTFTNMLLRTLPPSTRDHYTERLKKFMVGWFRRGYDVIPQEAPPQLEAKQWAPSWRRMAKCLLRNDYWCKGLGQTQPKSAAWLRFKEIKKRQIEPVSVEADAVDLFRSVSEQPISEAA